MKRLNLLHYVAVFTVFILAGCEENPGITDKKFDTSKFPDLNSEMHGASENTECKVIDFDTQEPAFAAGSIVSEVYSTDGTGPVIVSGINPRPEVATNAAMIFDSSNPTGNDPDLGSPNMDFGGPGIGVGGEAGSPYQNDVSLGYVLIVSEDLDSSDPDDEGPFEGAQLIMDFSGMYADYDNVSISYIDIMDIEDNETGENAFVELLDKDDNVIQKIELPAVGDNGYTRVNFDYYPFVYKLLVEFQGSGAIDNIAFCLTDEEEEEGCTLTQGYYKNPKHFDDWCGVAPGDVFYLSGHDYLTALSAPTKGNAYYILSQQYVAAINNVCNGASVPTEVQDAIDDADGWFSLYTPAQVSALSGNDVMRSAWIEAAGTLDDYNNGIIGPGHCDD